MSKPAAMIFDVFGTVVDWRSGVANECAGIFAEKSINFSPLEFADRWRGEYQPAMQRIRAGNRGYVKLDELHRENLDRVLEATGLSGKFSQAERDELNHAWEKLPPWPDSAEGLSGLKKNFLIAPCSNGSIALMARLAKFAGLPWDAIVGADIARDYKPKPEVYLKSAEALGCQPSQIMMVAAHNDDLFAARNAGLMTAFVHRPTEYGPEQKTDLEAESDWDFIAFSLTELASMVPAGDT